MRHGSLFSGFGGFDLAAEWMGWENVFQCEKDPFCRRVLKYYWPEAVGYEDIKSFDAVKYRGAVDIISGGFPCQPFSAAGKRKGTADDRYLWPEMLRIIREIRPRWVVGENVRGLLNWKQGVVFEQMQTDLETSGYEVWSFILPAAGVGAPHRRERVWIVAYAGCKSWDGREGSTLRRDDYRKSEGWNETADFTLGLRPTGLAANTNRFDRRTGAEGKDGKKASHSSKSDASNADRNERSKGRMHSTRLEEAKRHPGTRDARTFRETWENFPTESPVCGPNDGLPDQLDGITFSKWRKESLKGYGNAIVPQVALEIFKVIAEMEKK
jgi:DNA (cytosine-5)-methyltransferase 1